LLDELTAGAVYVGAPFRAVGTLPLRVALEDDGAVENIPTGRELEMGGGVLDEAQRLEGWEGVEGYVDSRRLDV
jgi:hypothetical protein